ncbi:bacteriophage abortive infection AbiH family protein [Rhizobium ruizarguesonis]
MTTLFIIGNGFDLHHGIDSRYADFGKYLHTADRDIHDAVEDFLPTWVDENGKEQNAWADLENNLEHFDVDQLLDVGNNFLPSYGAEDWRESGHHDFEYEIRKIVEALSSGLHHNFVNWLKTLVIPNFTPSPVSIIDPHAKFLNFNYTPTLQKVYGVLDVLHIHGSLTEPASKIVLGHGWKPEGREQWESRINEETDTRVAGGYRLIDEYFQQTFKPTGEIVQQNQDFFRNLGTVSHVYILGHGMSEVDSPYYEEILRGLPTKVDWTISYFGDEADKARSVTSAVRLGIPRHRASFTTLDVL